MAEGTPREVGANGAATPAVPRRFAGARLGRWAWVAALLPPASALLVLWTWALPPGLGEQYLSLVGDWQVLPVEAGAERPPPMPPGTRSLRMPGTLDAVGLDGREVWLTREVALPPAMRGADLRLLLGYMFDATVRVFVDGRLVGQRGVYRSGFIGSDSEVASVFIPGESLGDAATVRVTLQLKPNAAEQSGIGDGRLLLGRDEVLTPWLFHQASARGALEQGAVSVLALLAVLLLSLWWLQRGRVEVDLYRGTLALCAATWAYIAVETGFGASAWLSPAASVQGMNLTVLALGLAIPEFIEAYFVGRVTWARWVNRVVSTAVLLGAFAWGRVDARAPQHAYELYTNWLFLLMAWSLFLAGRHVWRRESALGPLLLSTIVFAVLAGLFDLLNDLGVFYTPRLFTLGITNLGICAAIVVVGEFVQVAEVNRLLSAELGEKNVALAGALARAEESSRAKSEFLASTSHELRTPLNAIINIPQGLLESVVETRRTQCEACRAVYELEAHERPEDVAACPACGGVLRALEPTWTMDLEPRATARLLNSVVRSGQHLLAMVNDILDFSKLDAARAVLHREPVEVDALLEAVRETQGPVALRQQVELVVRPLGERLALEVDRVKVTQVLFNLVSNALKFSDGKGRVTVGATRVPAGVAFAVSDQGIGIAPEHQQLIFEAFRQVEGGSTRRFGGTGLGLAISRKLAELHGGTLTVQSTPGQGSTFTLTVPLGVPAVEPKQAQRSEERPS